MSAAVTSRRAAAAVTSLGETRSSPPLRRGAIRQPLALGLQPLQFLQDLVESQALDELHHVIGQPLVFADAEDRHDVGVVQPGRRAGLPLEPLLGPGVHQELTGQDLQRDVAAERDLLGLVDDAHAAAADLADDPVIAQPLQRGSGPGAGRLGHLLADLP